MVFWSFWARTIVAISTIFLVGILCDTFALAWRQVKKIANRNEQQKSRLIPTKYFHIQDKLQQLKHQAIAISIANSAVNKTSADFLLNYEHFPQKLK